MKAIRGARMSLPNLTPSRSEQKLNRTGALACESISIWSNRRRPRESLVLVVLVLVIGNGAVADEDEKEDEDDLVAAPLRCTTICQNRREPRRFSERGIYSAGT